MTSFAVRPVPLTVIGRKKALAVKNRRSWLNLTGAEALGKLIRFALGYDGEILARAYSDYRIMPWASGQGLTTELFVSPDGSQLKDKSAVWRVSLAAVSQDCDFSRLEGYQRIITLIDGAGFVLRGKETVEVRKGMIRALSGDERVNCGLIDGPCLDLNVIYKPDQVAASLEILRFEERAEHLTIETREDETLMLICLDGKGRIVGDLRGTISQFASFRATRAEIGNSLTLKSLRAGTRFALVRISAKVK